MANRLVKPYFAAQVWERAFAIGKGMLGVESAMVATITPDDLVDQAKEHLLHFRQLALGKRVRPQSAKPEGEAK